MDSGRKASIIPSEKHFYRKDGPKTVLLQADSAHVLGKTRTTAILHTLHFVSRFDPTNRSNRAVFLQLIAASNACPNVNAVL